MADASYHADRCDPLALRRLKRTSPRTASPRCSLQPRFSTKSPAAPRMHFAHSRPAFGGERADATCVRQRPASTADPARLLHVYGPTETTTFATCHRIEHAEKATPCRSAGPIANTQVYLLDPALQLGATRRRRRNLHRRPGPRARLSRRRRADGRAVSRYAFRPALQDRRPRTTAPPTARSNSSAASTAR